MRHGRIPIQDEFTDRRDLTAGQKYYLRHPELRSPQARETIPGIGNKPVRKARTDLGLALLSLIAKPGVPLSQEDIAAWCGCSRTTIYLIEKSALKKMRHRLGPECAAMLDLFNERHPAERIAA